MPNPSVPLHRAMPAVDGFCAVLTVLADAVEASWQGAVDGIDPEALHDLRVALRRTRSVLRHGRTVLPPGVATEAGERFAALAARTSAPRDLDVMLIEWDAHAGALGDRLAADVDALRALVAERQRAAHVELAAALGAPGAIGLLAAWREQLAGLPAQPAGERAAWPLGAVVRRRITTAQARLVARGRAIGPGSPPADLHAARKAAKQLRYLFECFGGLVPGDLRDPFVDRLKALQDVLGAHQDAAVHVALVDALAGELGRRGATPAGMYAAGRLAGQIDHARLAARDRFVEQFAAYDAKATRRALRAVLAAVDPERAGATRPGAVM